MPPRFVCAPPGPKSRAIVARDRTVMSPSLTREYDFAFKDAKGVWVWDADGRRYLDFAAAVAVMNVGHANPAVHKAVLAQARHALHCGFSDFYAELPVRFTERLLRLLPRPLSHGRVFLSNSGTESVEAAYKLSRWHTKKKWVIAFRNAFHGRTMGSLSMTNSKPVQRERFGPFLPVEHAEFPHPYRTGEEPELCAARCLAGVEALLKKHRRDVAAVFLEPIQGEGGYIVPPKSFVRGLRELCDRAGALLCVDEVQSGCYRTGPFLAIQNFKVAPDIVAMSKSIGGGLPLGATVAREDLMDWVPGAHANTFGGNLLACAAGIAALDFLHHRRLGAHAAHLGSEMLRWLRDLDSPLVGDVRGLGLMIGVELSKPGTNQPAPGARKAALCAAAERRLLLLPSGESTIRICPPLILSRSQAKRGVAILGHALEAARPQPS